MEAAVSAEAQTATSALVRDYLAPLTPGKTLERLLSASFDPEVTATRLSELVEANPLYAHYLQKLDVLQEKVKKWKEDFPEEKDTARITRFIITLIGAASTRNAVLSIWIARRAAGGLPKKDGSPFIVSPKTQLKYALIADEYSEANRLNDKDLAYVAGFCFDWMTGIVEKKGGTAKSEKKFVEEGWAEAVLTARLAYELASIPKNMPTSRFAFSSVMMIFLGKFLMAASFPKGQGGRGWREFQKHCQAHGARADLTERILEKREFPFTHAEAAALSANQIQLFRPSVLAIRYYQEPYLLRELEPKSFQLATVVLAAHRMVRTKSPVVSLDILEMLSGLLNPEDLSRAYSRTVGKRDS